MLSIGPEEKKRWMLLAMEQAKYCVSKDEVPVGAVIVHRGEIIGWGHNLRESTRHTSSHAEMNALWEYNNAFKQWRFKPEVSLFVTTEPCLMCTGAFLWARVDAIYYGCRDPRKAGIERIKPLIDEGVFDHRIKLLEGDVLGEECATLLTDYFAGKRREETC
jgi:tRNA(adenine34) deaminase